MEGDIMKNLNSMSTYILILFVLTGVSGLIPIMPVSAMMIELGLEDIAKESDYVVQGEVVDTKSEWNENKTRIYTYSTVAVKENISGSAPKTVFVKQKGGTVGNITLSVSDSLLLHKGDEVVVFLKPEKKRQASVAARGSVAQGAREGEIAQIVGERQGKYEIKKGAAAGKGAVTVGRGIFATKEGRIVHKAGKEVPLDEFKSQIKGLKNKRR